MLYIKELEIENVRCFGKKQSLKFTHASGKISQWTVILGDNGSGKTTLLKSIVALLPAPKSFLYRRHNSETEYELSIREWEKEWSLKRNYSKSNSKLKLVVSESEVPFNNKNSIDIPLTYEKSYKEKDLEYYFSERSSFNTFVLSPVNCFAYGANRKVAPNSLSGNKILEANETLFKEDAFLSNSEEFFLQMDYESAKSRKGSEQINKVKNLLLKVLPSGIQDIKVGKKGPLLREVLVKTPYGWVNINELSLGYKTTIAWLIDFATKMIYFNERKGNDDPFDEPAILIIDEIDLHMHPAWQYEIIENLTKLFRKTQFIVTAHSPLIVQTALETNIALLKRHGNHVEIISDPEIVRTWRVDQILTSDLFGLENARPKKVQKLLDQRSKLLGQVELNEVEEKKLKNIETALGEIPVYEDKYERQAYSAIDKIAELLKSKSEI